MEFENKLTKTEINCLKHTLTGGSIMTRLEIVFGISWGTFMLFFLITLVKKLSMVRDIHFILIVFVILIGIGIVFLLCIVSINSRNRKIMDVLQKGKYKLIRTMIMQKDWRYVGLYRSKAKVLFYKSSEINGEITPVSEKQFNKAQIGDKIKVVMIDIDQIHLAYGFLEYDSMS